MVFPCTPFPLATIVPATFKVTSTRLEAGVGDRLSPVPQQELVAYVPQSPLMPDDMTGAEYVLLGRNPSATATTLLALADGPRLWLLLLALAARQAPPESEARSTRV